MVRSLSRQAARTVLVLCTALLALYTQGYSKSSIQQAVSSSKAFRNRYCQSLAGLCSSVRYHRWRLQALWGCLPWEGSGWLHGGLTKCASECSSSSCTRAVPVGAASFRFACLTGLHNVKQKPKNISLGGPGTDSVTLHKEQSIISN